MYQYKHFIPENIAPVGSKRIGVYDANDKKVCTIPLGGLTPPNTPKIYSFCVLSDIHLDADRNDSKVAAFTQALDYVNDAEDCAFSVICGDLVDNGATQAQVDNYKTVVSETAEKPVYAISGNHDTIWGYPTDERMESYTGKPLYYTVSNSENPSIAENDLLIFLGHYGKDHSGGNGDWRGGEQFSAEELNWFANVLENNPEKRCFVFIHPAIPGGAGYPPLTITPPNQPPDIWTKKASVDADTGQEFLDILKRYPGAILFNGHTHYRFRTQEEESKAVIYTPEDGSYTSVHVPSATRLRDVIDGQRVDYDGVGEGYIIDVYDDCIVLNGWDFIGNKPIPLGTLKIDT